jgi:hypothetical protein
MNIVSSAVKELTGHNPQSLPEFIAIHKEGLSAAIKG